MSRLFMASYSAMGFFLCHLALPARLRAVTPPKVHSQRHCGVQARLRAVTPPKVHSQRHCGVQARLRAVVHFGTQEHLRHSHCTACVDVEEEKTPVPFPFRTMEEFILLQRAIILADRVHKDQYRLDGNAYMTHPLAVMQILMETDIELPPNAYIAAVLHDVLEYDYLCYPELSAHFGPEVADVVWALSKPIETSECPSTHSIGSGSIADKSDNSNVGHTELNRSTTRPAKAELAQGEKRTHLYLAQMQRVNAKYPYVLLVKLADRIHNVETVRGMPRERRERFLDETGRLYLPVFLECAARNINGLRRACLTLIRRLEKEMEKQKHLMRARNGLRFLHKSPFSKQQFHISSPPQKGERMGEGLL